MKKINYKNFKNDEMYFLEKNGSYESISKTIYVYDRSVVEFDFEIIKGFEPVHVRFINVCNEKDKIYYGTLRPAFIGAKATNDEYFLSGGKFKTINSKFEEVYKEFIDKYFKVVEVDDKDDFIETLKRRIKQLSSIEKVEKMIAKGQITNLTEYAIEDNICVSKGDLDKQTIDSEEEKEEEMKVIRMKYYDYKKNWFRYCKR